VKAVHRLDEVCEVVMGQAPSGEAYNTDGKGWPLIAGAGDFGETTPQAKKFTTEASKLSRDGDIVLGIRASIGEKVVADGEYCLGRGVAGLRARESLESRFLWHWLTHSAPRLAAKAKGATFKQVNREDIGELEIHLPPLAEQRRIAVVLDWAEALRAKRRAALAQLDSLTQSLFLDLFGDPVVNPKSWSRKKFSEIGALDRGISKHRPRNAPELLGGPYPLVQTGEVANCDGYIREYHSTYSEVGLRQSKMWPAGTLCITIAANIAKTGILTFDACFPDSIVGFRADDEGTVEFVRGWLSFLQKSLEDAAPESAQKNINLALLRNLVVPLPPIELQREFARRVRAVEKLKTAQRASLAELDALFASLQHRAFRGEL
jgi:type I restriction enzyme S subunit